MKRKDNNIASRREILDYLFDYIHRYREEYQKAVAEPPNGGGLPKVPVSPYLSDGVFTCLLSRNGAVIFSSDRHPDYDWWIAGGPAMKVDYEPTKTPAYVSELLKKNNLVGKSIGIYRIVSKEILPDEIWCGNIEPKRSSLVDKRGNIELKISEFDESLERVVSRLTFGALGSVLDIRIDQNSDSFWKPFILTNLGFFPADCNGLRFINYMEVLPHRNRAAWHKKSIRTRVISDVRRDFARCAGKQEEVGMISIGDPDLWVENYQRSLHRLGESISALDDLLRFNADANEDVFHNFLRDHPFILDIYGTIDNKPKFRYPQGQSSSIGKTYVEPDFIIRYPDGTYKLVELERAAKLIKTRAGHPRQDIGQAAFQVAEWKSYISEHYNLLRDRYPNISSRCPSMVVISRDRQSGFSSREEIERYIATLKNQYNIDEILTYDDVLKRARILHAKLSNLGR